MYICVLKSLRLKGLRYPLEISNGKFWGNISKGYSRKQVSRLLTQRKTVPDRKSMPVVKAFKRSLFLQHVATAYLNEHNQTSSIPVPRLGHKALIYNSLSSSSILS